MERLSNVAEFIAETARASGLDENQVYDVQMAVDEACTNIIQHAYHGRADGTIDIVCEPRGNEFVVTIRDYGDHFDPKKVAKPDTRRPLELRKIGGLGLFFIYTLMDRVKFDFSTTRGNELTMVKKIKK